MIIGGGIKEGRKVNLYILNVNVCFSSGDVTNTRRGCFPRALNRKKGTSVGVVAEQQGFNDYALIVAEIIDFMNSDNKMIQDDMDEILGLLQDGVAGTRNSKHKDDEL